MTLVEGYAEHVMDAVGDQLDPGYTDLRRALDRDRERRGLLDSIVSKVLGLEMKLAQYRRGKAFADEVVRAHGIRTLNRAWSEPEALPRPDELDSPASGSSVSALPASIASSPCFASSSAAKRCNSPSGAG